MQSYTAPLRFTCPGCGVHGSTEIRMPGTDWTGDTADERYVEEDGEVTCGRCGETMAIRIGNQDGTATVAVLDRPGTEVEIGPVELVEDWDVDYAPDPYGVITATLRDARDILDRHGDEVAASTINRMVFVQQVAALEAYLCDTLMIAIDADDAALGRLVRVDGALGEVTVSLAEVLKGGEAREMVRRRARQRLRRQLYHRLDEVERLYRTVVGIELFPEPWDRIGLVDAMPLRHDCVHRNGFDRDGARLGEPRAVLVRGLENDIRALVERVEGQLRGAR